MVRGQHCEWTLMKRLENHWTLQPDIAVLLWKYPAGVIGLNTKVNPSMSFYNK